MWWENDWLWPSVNYLVNSREADLTLYLCVLAHLLPLILIGSQSWWISHYNRCGWRLGKLEDCSMMTLLTYPELPMKFIESRTWHFTTLYCLKSNWTSLEVLRYTLGEHPKWWVLICLFVAQMMNIYICQFSENENADT